ncbi:MAG: PAS domain S-box protein [Dethiosulfatibacter sp.]|nr:PAS domain S-box protein [Dethiosulfatibacter sp.]
MKRFSSNKQRKNNEKQFQTWNNLTRHIIENSPNAIAVHDKDMKYLFVSKKYIETYRVNESHIIGKHHYEVFPDLPEKWREVHKRVLNGAIESADDDPYYREDGTVDYTRWEARPWYEVNGDIGGIIIYTEIINEWKNQMQSFKESEERFRLLVETAPDSIFVYIDKKLAYANHAAAKLVGFSDPDEIIGSNFMDLLNPESNVEVENQYRVFLEEKKPICNMEQTFLLANCKSIDVEINTVPIKYHGKDGELVYVRDISERKRAEREKDERLQQERHQQKLESIGTLASGVAHEINNPVTGIINYAQLILDEADPSCDCSAFAKEIITESQRIAEIVNHLLVFSRNEKQSHSKADIYDIVNQTLTLIRALIRKDQIEIKLNIPEDLPSLKCRSQQIQQVIMNLLTNARDAMNTKYPESNENKVITISAYMYNFEGRRWIRLTVEDFGNGIPENIRERIFDPFFTTKSKDLGTGLGLPISYGIVKDHHGNLTFETSVGEFTRFYLDLPVDNGWHI